MKYNCDKSHLGPQPSAARAPPSRPRCRPSYSRAEGVPVPGRPGYHLFVDDGEPSAGLPRAKTVYLPIGGALIIEMVAVG